MATERPAAQSHRGTQYRARGASHSGRTASLNSAGTPSAEYPRKQISDSENTLALQWGAYYQSKLDGVRYEESSGDTSCAGGLFWHSAASLGDAFLGCRPERRPALSRNSLGHRDL